MQIRLSDDCDPHIYLDFIKGWNVAVDGLDYHVQEVTDEGLVLCPYDEDKEDYSKEKGKLRKWMRITDIYIY
jgi:hypothetical protein